MSVANLVDLMASAPRALNVGIKPVTPMDDGPIATLFGVPVGFQFGTAFGIKNPFARLAVDILSDPITYLTGGIGGLTKLGKAVRFAKGMSAVDKAAEVSKVLELAAKAANRTDLAQTAVRLADAGDAVGVARIAQEFKAMRPPPEVKSLFNRRTQGDLVNLFAETERVGGNLPRTLADTLSEQAKMGQRALVQFTVPFSGIQRTIISGVPVFSALERKTPALLTAIKSTVAALPGGRAADDILKAAKDARTGTSPAIVASQLDSLGEAIRGADLPDYGKHSFQSLNDVRNADLESMNFRADLAANELRAAIPDAKTRSAIPFLLQRGQPVGKSEQAYLDTVLDFYESSGSYLQENGLIKGLIDNYVGPQIWDIKTGKDSALLSILKDRLKRNTKFGLHRAIHSLDEGIKLGLKPKTTDIADLLKVYVNDVSKAVANNRFLESLKFAADPASGQPMIRFAEEIPKKGRHEFIRGLLDAGWVQTSKLGKKVYASPEVAREIDVMLSPGLFRDSKFLRSAFQVNMVAKGTALGLSLFHVQALTESAIAALGMKFLRNPKQLTDAGINLMRQGADVIQIGVRNGLTLGGIDDMGRESLETAMSLMAKSPRVQASLLKNPINGLKKANDIYQRFLWDYYHNGLKSAAFAELYKEALKKHGATFNPDIVASEVAAYVNNSFGGLNWRRMAVDKKWQNGMQIALFAADWTTSNLLIARDVVMSHLAKLSPDMANKILTFAKSFEKKPGTIVPQLARTLFGDLRDVNSLVIRSDFARQYALRAGAAFASTLAIGNLVFSGHFPWENAEGHKLDIELPGEDAKGRKRYVRLGKQFKEPFEWILEPRKRFSSKLGFLPRTFVTATTGRDLFGRPLYTAEDGPVSAVFKFGYGPMLNFVPLPIRSTAEAFFTENVTPEELTMELLGFPVGREFIRKRA